jgi:hypothetical protein
VGSVPIATGAFLAGRATDQPSVAALVADPDRVVEVPVNQIATMVASLASEQARLVAIQGVLMRRLLASQPTATNELADRLLGVEEVAKALGVTRRWVPAACSSIAVRASSLSARGSLFRAGPETMDGESSHANRVRRCFDSGS